VREALFSIWAQRLPGARFLDLFAGSGVVGIEALSRGADFIALVEGDRRRFHALVATLREVDNESSDAYLLHLPAELGKLSSRTASTFDLVFADPPYAFDDVEALLDGGAQLLAAGGELAIEHSRRRQVALPHDALAVVDERNYGESSLTFFQRR